MIYLSSLSKLWYTGCPLCSLSCISWYSPRLPGYFSDDDPLLVSWIFRGFNGFLGSISLNKNSIGTYSYDKVVHLIQDGGQWWRQPPIQFVIQIPLTLRVSSSSHLPSPNFQPLAGIAATWTLSSVFTRASPLEFSQSTLHWSNLSNNNW